jgi:Uma2 family endonuclease
MSTTAVGPIEEAVDVSSGPRRKKWTRHEIAALATTGVIDVEHLELVEGELFDTLGKNWPHRSTARELYFLLQNIFGQRQVMLEEAIGVAPGDWLTSEPESYVAVVGRPLSSFKGTPQPEELLLVVEVSYTSLRYDLTTKAGLYARAGIAEYWVVNVNGRASSIEIREKGSTPHEFPMGWANQCRR